MSFRISSFLLLYLLFSSQYLLGQSPPFINYQAAARNSETGEGIVNQEVLVIAKIFQNGPQGTLVYQEEHAETQTNSYGLFNIRIGEGDALFGSFSNIDWSTGNTWLEIDLDIGNGLETMGAMQFVSVPYAFHAETVSNPDDADADPQNELISELTFDENSGTLSIVEQGNSTSVDLSSLSEDDDADPTNEAISSVSLQGDFLIINEAEDWAINLDQFYEDADADPENEAIDENGIVLFNDSILQISEGGTIHSVNLGPLRNDDDWKISDDESVVYNNTSKVGVGTSTPNSLFEVNGSLGLRYTLVENTVNSNYTIQDEDHIVIIRQQIGGALQVTVDMPDPETCEGRVLVIKRVGEVLAQTVLLNFNGHLLDFEETDSVLLDGPFDQSSTFISLGENGWVNLDEI